jgi:hypothetical protein
VRCAPWSAVAVAAKVFAPYSVSAPYSTVICGQGLGKVVSLGVSAW